MAGLREGEQELGGQMLAYKEVLYQRSFKKERTRVKGVIRVFYGEGWPGFSWILDSGG